MYKRYIRSIYLYIIIYIGMIWVKKFLTHIPITHVLNVNTIALSYLYIYVEVRLIYMHGMSGAGSERRKRATPGNAATAGARPYMYKWESAIEFLTHTTQMHLSRW